MKTFVVGDLHGHFDQFMLLIDKITKEVNYNPESDTLIQLGDLVDGGSQTKQVIDWCIEDKKKYPHHQFLYGNHEDLMLDALVYNGRIYDSYDLWWNQGGRETYQSYLPSNLSAYEKAISQVKDHIPFEHLDWLRNLPYYFEDENYFFVHAGIPNNTSFADFKEKIDKNDEQIKQEAIWIRDEFLQSNKDWGKKIIFGHTIFPYGPYEGTNPETGKKTRQYGFPFIQKNKIGIDGMMHNQGNLICLQLPEEKFYFQESMR